MCVLVLWQLRLHLTPFCVCQSAVASQIVHGPRNGLPQLCVAMTVLHLLLSLSALLYFIIVRIGHWTIWKEYSRRGPLDPETKMN